MDRKGMIKAIWTISSNLELRETGVYQLLYGETNKAKMSDCTDAELQKLLKALDSLKETKKPKNGRITTKQYNYIKALEKQIGWADEPKHLRSYIKKYAKIDFLEWLTSKQASNIIIALKNIKLQMTGEEIKERKTL